MQCSKCNKEIIGISYLISKGIIEIEDENSTNSKVNSSSLLCPDCTPEIIKTQSTNYNDCTFCDIKLKNNDVSYTIYKVSGQNIKTAIGICENCIRKVIPFL